MSSPSPTKTAYCRANRIKPVGDKWVARSLAEMGASDGRYRTEGIDVYYWEGLIFKENSFFGAVAQDGYDSYGFYTYIEIPKNDIGQKTVGNLDTLGTTTKT